MLKIAKSIRLKKNVKLKKNSWRYKFLTIVLCKSTDYDRVLKSRWMWGKRKDGVYTLRILGVLHTLFNLVIEIDEDDGEYH